MILLNVSELSRLVPRQMPSYQLLTRIARKASKLKVVHVLTRAAHHLSCIFVQVEKLINELSEAGAKALGIQLDDGTLPRLSAYAKSVAHFPTAVKEARVYSLVGNEHDTVWM